MIEQIFLTHATKHVFTEGDSNPAPGVGDDPPHSSGRSSPAGTTGRTGSGSVPVESDGVLQGLQRSNAKVQAGYAHGRDHHRLQG